MNWYFVRDNVIEGPVSPEEFQTRLSEGLIRPETLVWREGMKGWMPFGTLGSLSAQPWRPDQWQQQDLRTPVGPILSQAWQLFSENAGPMVGLVCLFFLLTLAVGLAGLLVSLLVPLGNVLVTIAVVGPLSAGLQLAALHRVRGQPLEFGTVFKPFGPRYGQLVLQQVVQQSIQFVFLLIMMLGFAAMFFSAISLVGDLPSLPSWMSPLREVHWSLGLLLAGAVVGMLGMTVYFYLLVAWLYAPLLVVDKGMPFWDAMQLSRRVSNQHPWLFSWFLLVASVVGSLGMLLCGIGVVLSAPIALLMVVIGYQRVYGQLDSGS